MKCRYGHTWTNWAGNQRCTTTLYCEPETEEAIAAVVLSAARAGKRIRVVGSGHSFSPIALSDDVHINLQRYNRLLAINGSLVTCQAGMRLRDLYAALAAAGLSLHNYGVINQQTVAGALATGTHGSGARHPSLSAAIESLTLVLADGTRRTIDRTSTLTINGTPYPLWEAASVSLGLLGIVSTVTLRCEPLFYLRAEEHTLAFDDYIDTMDDLAQAHEYFKAWWFPHTGKVSLFKADRISAADYADRARSERYTDAQRRLDRQLDAETAPLFVQSLAQPDIIPAINRYCLETYFTPKTRIGTAMDILVHDETVPMVVAEYALPREGNTHREALRAFHDDIEQGALPLHFPVDLRNTAAEAAWLSPAYGRDSFYIGMCVREYRAPGIPAVMQRFFTTMQAHGGRPNWGKLFAVEPAELAALYPRLADFRRVRQQLDPDNRFLNDALATWFGD